MSKAMIQLDHIDVTFQQKKRQIQAVKDVTIHINEGDILWDCRVFWSREIDLGSGDQSLASA